MPPHKWPNKHVAKNTRKSADWPWTAKQMILHWAATRRASSPEKNESFLIKKTFGLLIMWVGFCLNRPSWDIFRHLFFLLLSRKRSILRPKYSGKCLAFFWPTLWCQLRHFLVLLSQLSNVYWPVANPLATRRHQLYHFGNLRLTFTTLCKGKSGCLMEFLFYENHTYSSEIEEAVKIHL